MGVGTVLAGGEPGAVSVVETCIVGVRSLLVASGGGVVTVSTGGTRGAQHKPKPRLNSVEWTWTEPIVPGQCWTLWQSQQYSHRRWWCSSEPLEAQYYWWMEDDYYYDYH